MFLILQPMNKTVTYLNVFAPDIPQKVTLGPVDFIFHFRICFASLRRHKRAQVNTE